MGTFKAMVVVQRQQHVCASTTRRRTTGSARRTRVVSGARAKLTGNNWLPGSKRPEHLDGSRPGDVGFDPLGLSKEPDSAVRLREAEIIHGRYAMLGAAGCLAVELAGQGTWIDAPKWALTGATPTYFGVEVPVSLPVILFVEVIAMAYVESQRGAAEDPEIRCYPGGTFDPLNFANRDAKQMMDLKEKELANGRLAMVAMLGFFAQGSATSAGPVANLTSHLADPWAVNVATNGVSLPFLAYFK